MRKMVLGLAAIGALAAAGTSEAGWRSRGRCHSHYVCCYTPIVADCCPVVVTSCDCTGTVVVTGTTTTGTTTTGTTTATDSGSTNAGGGDANAQNTGGQDAASTALTEEETKWAAEMSKDATPELKKKFDEWFAGLSHEDRKAEYQKSKQ